jgi:acyl-CoA dehydrogenase
LSELGSLLADTVTRLFTDLVTKELIESSEKGVWPDKLWRALEEGGLTLPLVAESAGGAGGTWLDTHVVVRAAGRHAAPVPLAETIVAGALLSRAGLEVPFGPLTLAPVHRDERLTLSRSGGSWRVSGTATRVPWGRAAGHVVTVADVDGAATVGLIAPSTAKITEDKNLALEPRDTLVFDNAPVVAAAPAAGVSRDTIRLYGAMVRAAQMAGALDSILDQGVRYATERKQFGRPIGNFQALQHYLAVVAGHVAASGIAAELAFRAADREDTERAGEAREPASSKAGEAREPASFIDVAVAKIRVGEAAGVSAGLVHQVHGAIGFTYEHSLHFATRRLWSWRAEFGSESVWAIELGRRVAARGSDNLWNDLTER